MSAPNRLLYALIISTSLISTGARADDPPLRVGRISYIEGDVSFHAADESDWSYATVNYPVLSGNAFWTEPNGRSEVQIGSVEIRMDHATEMEVTQLDENTTRLEVPQGVVNIHFSTVPVNGSVEVDTPAGPVELTRPGTYHIDSGAPGGATPQVQVTALEGQLEIPGQNSLLEVMPGETAILTGNPPAFSLQEGSPTPFDDWALARERREEAHNASQYVSTHMTGYEDLDYYGQWTPDPTYGTVWYPTAVQSGWAPYRNGHWAFIAPWGWTWVDDAPWGFAPFHYGRWANLHDRWCWIPGTVVERPIYAPALVAFIGGAGWSVSLSVGNAMPAVGWVPLGPQEVFHPYYPTSVNYVRNVNITNVNRTVINNITVNNIHNVSVTNYVNQGAATVMSAHAFQEGQPVHKAFLAVKPEQIAHAPFTPTLAHLSPAPAAREEGRPMSPQAQSAIAHPPAVSRAQEPQENRTHEPQENAAAPSPHMPPPQRQEEHYTPPESKPAMQAQKQVPAAPAHAPGPPIRHLPTPQPQQAAAHAPAPQPRPNLPHAEVPHPQQHTQIKPTPQGWQRVPVQHEEKPQPHPPAHPEHDERRPEEQR